jgi:2-keto-4-pentenoate hydratase/2-oxohepta-3-ene-1,7-dioic acid hydratase in catechol pathway
VKLCAFENEGCLRLGRVEGREVVDLSAAAPELPATLAALLAAGPQALDRAASAPAKARLPLGEVRLTAPIPRPRNFFAVGMNYARHAREMGRPLPDFPTCYAKPPGCIVGPYDPIVRPAGFSTLDYEGELGVVIGRRCKDVPRARALEVVAGFLVVNDVSVREMLFPERLVLAKGCDSFGPTGPWLTTPDEVAVGAGLSIRTWVDGQLRQDSSTADLIFGVDRLIEVFSRGITLEPGDIITTGSPPGTGASFKPPRYLEPGQTVEVEIEGLGRISNRVEAQVRRTGEEGQP